MPPTGACSGDLHFTTPSDVTWELPHFISPVTGQIIDPWCSRQPGEYLGPGYHVITCTAANPDNGVEITCEFEIAVEGLSILNFCVNPKCIVCVQF